MKKDNSKTAEGGEVSRFVFVCFQEKREKEKEKEYSSLWLKKKNSVFLQMYLLKWVGVRPVFIWTLDCSCFPSRPLCSQVLQLLISQRCACIPRRAFPAGKAQKREDFSTLEQLHVWVHWAGGPHCGVQLTQNGSPFLPCGPCTRHCRFHCDSHWSVGKGSKTILTHCRNLSYSTHQRVRFFTAMPPVPLQPWHGQWEGSRAALLVSRSCCWVQKRPKKNFPFPGEEFAALGGLGAPLMAILTGVLPCWATRCLVLA